MKAVAVIELESDWESRQESRSPASSRRRVLAAAGLLLVLMLGGSAPARPAFSQLAALPAKVGSTFDLAGEQIFTLTRGPGGMAVVTAYGLPRGTQQWSTTLPQGIDVVRLVAPGVLLAETLNGGGADQRVAVLDPVTGRVRWQTGEASVWDVRPESGRLLLVSPGPNKPTAMRVVELGSGRLLWSQPLSDQVYPLVGSSGSIVAQSPDGLTRVVDEDSGRLLAEARLPAPSVTDQAMFTAPTSWYQIGDQLLFMYSQHGVGVVTAYASATLTQRWRVTFQSLVNYVAPCGPMLCLGDQRTLTAVDPATGAVRWHSERWLLIDSFDDRLLAKAILADDYAILDTATGRQLLDLGTWSLLPQNRSRGPVMLARERTGPPGVWFGVLDEKRLAIAPLGWLTGLVKERCQASAAYLACLTTDGPLRVWRYRPPR
jgi:hypothetical protein